MTKVQALRLLLVEDSAPVRRIVRRILAGFGIEQIDEVEDGGQALARIADVDYDLVITDWDMEPVGGLELIQRIREDDSTKDMPVIMVSSNSSTQHVVMAKEAGASSYIVKPFTAKALRDKIAGVLKIDAVELSPNVQNTPSS